MPNNLSAKIEYLNNHSLKWIFLFFPNLDPKKALNIGGCSSTNSYCKDYAGLICDPSTCAYVL